MVYHRVAGVTQAVFLGLALAMPAFAQTAPAPAAPKVDLKLFERAEVDRSKGCSFALWQSNRDPEKDRYAYIFVENIGRNSVRENARIKVGNDVLTFRRVAVGGAQEFGNKTFPNALYKADKDASYLILDLKLAVAPGEIVEAQGGSMTVIRPGFPPFVAEVRARSAATFPMPTRRPPHRLPPCRSAPKRQRRRLKRWAAARRCSRNTRCPATRSRAE